MAVDLGFIVFCALLMGIGYGTSAKSFVAVSLLGGFAAYLLVFDSDPARRHGNLARMFVGVAFGLPSALSIGRQPSYGSPPPWWAPFWVSLERSGQNTSNGG
jgi:hypothetical protein